MIKNFLLITIRSMMKNKLFIFINIFGLAIGIGCSIVAYFNWEYDAYFDLNHTNADRIYRISMVREFDGNKRLYGLVPEPLGENVAQLADVNKSSRYFPDWGNIKVEDNLFHGGIAYVDPEFFEMFSFDFISGNPSNLQDRTTIFINDELSLRLFGTLSSLGKQLTVVHNDKLKEFKVGGVFRKAPPNSSFDRSTYINYENIYEDRDDVKRADWTSRNSLFVQIDDLSRNTAVHKQLQQYLENNNKVREDFILTEYALDPFVKMARRDSDSDTWSQTNRANHPAAVFAPTVMALLILLIACFNMTNTSIAISSRRLKEIGIRKVMGSMRSQLIFQFIGETLFICFLALVIGLFMGELLLRSWNALWPEMKLVSHYLDNINFVMFLVGTLLFTGLISGSYPAFYVSRFEPVSILKGTLRFGGTNWFTRVLLCLQYAFSLIGIIYAIAFYQNSIYQRDFDLGFQPKGLIVVWLKDRAECEMLGNALAENKDIVAISSTQHSIFASGYNDPVKFETKQVESDIYHVDDDYLSTMGMTLIKGRAFQKDSETDRKESIIISEKLAESFKWDDPIGKQIIWQDTVKLYVVGVVKNIYTNGLWEVMEPVILRYAEKDKHNILLVKAPLDKIADVNKFMETKWSSVFPNKMYSGGFVNGGTEEAYKVNDNIVKTFVFLGIVALLLSATGLFTLVSLNIIKRMKEIGVRKVLGASIANITKVINTEFLIILLLAALIGCVSSYFLVDLMMGSIWDYYESTGAVTFIVSVTLMLGVSALTIGSKVLNAASMNPVNTLRDE